MVGRVFVPPGTEMECVWPAGASSVKVRPLRLRSMPPSRIVMLLLAHVVLLTRSRGRPSWTATCPVMVVPPWTVIEPVPSSLPPSLQVKAPVTVRSPSPSSVPLASEKSPIVASASRVTVTNELIVTASAAPGTRPQLQLLAADQAPLPPIQVQVAARAECEAENPRRQERAVTRTRMADGGGRGRLAGRRLQRARGQ
jgi:hypothetical protein